MKNANSIKERIIEKLKDISPRRNYSIGDKSEIYYDLRISGDDLLELLDWISIKFGANFSTMRVHDYAPSEVEIYPLITRLWGRRPYKSLKVQDVVDAVVRGSW